MMLRNWLSFHLLKILGFDRGHIIRFFLEHQGITMRVMAKHLGVSSPYISMVIDRKRRSAKVEQAITKALGFNPWAAFF